MHCSDNEFQYSSTEYLVEEIEQVNVVGLLTEVFLQQVVDCTLEHERIVNGDHADTLSSVPTWLATTGDTSIHDIV